MTDPSKQIGLPFAPNSETSRQAAQQAKGKAATDRVRVLDFIRKMGRHGATSDEVQVALKLTHQNGSARVSELWHKFHLIKLSGKRRRTRSGSQAGVYVDAGLEMEGCDHG